MCDDRTSEFRNFAKGLPGAAAAGYNNPYGTPTRFGSSHNAGQTPTSAAASSSSSSSAIPPQLYAELRRFQHDASGLSKDIAGTSALLQELTTLVRQPTPWLSDAETRHMNSLVVTIKAQIESLNHRLDQAGVQMQRQKRQLGQNSQAGQQAWNAVDGLQEEFARAARGFKQVLQQRTDTMKESQSFQKQVYGTNNPHGGGAGGADDDDDNPMPNLSLALPPVYHQGGGAGAGGNDAFALDLTSGLAGGGMSAGQTTSSSSTPLPRPHGLSSYEASTPGSVMRHRGGGGGGSSLYGTTSFEEERQPLTPLDIQRMEEQSGLQMQFIPDQDYLQQRAQAMGQVEGHLAELGTIFNKLAVMVSEHQDMVQRVEDNVQDAQSNLDMAMGVLTDTLTNLRSNKQLALRLFIVLIVFVLGFVIFAA